VCGIAGIFHYRDSQRPVDGYILEAMTRSLAHRGPDGQGVWCQPGIGLGHRRLAIIDLSEAGRQPMADEAGNVITFNGEIYNYRELRAELDAAGFHSRSATDTEVILLGYRAWGTDVVKRLSGIFAFALWDESKRCLFVARDHLGVKPFFYSEVAGSFRFGSEIKALLTDPEQPRDYDPEALDAFLTFSYTPAPATGFSHVRQLLPGECGIVGDSGIKIWRYWSIPYAEQPYATPFKQAVDEFTALVDRVTKAQLVADVPVGAFLSGGLDSAAIVRSMTRARSQGVHALTVGFDAAGFDERDRARQTAGLFGVDLHCEMASLDAASLIPKLSLHMEEPTADSSMLPVYLLCRAARERFTVAISGDGADEILAGYETYRATRLAGAYRMLPHALRRGIIAPLARRLPVSDGKYSFHQVAVRFTEGAEQGAGRDHASWRVMLTPELKRRVYAADFARRVGNADAIGMYAAETRQQDGLAGLLHADTCFYLPNDMLVKVDRMSMAHGLEVRVPLLDIELVAFCANLPAEYKLAGGKTRKHILRESLRDSLPGEILNRPKSGFNIPVEAWMRGKLSDLLFDSVDRCRDELSGVLNIGEIRKLAEEHRKRRADHGHVLFTVMMLAMWFENRARAWRTNRLEAN